MIEFLVTPVACVGELLVLLVLATSILVLYIRKHGWKGDK